MINPITDTARYIEPCCYIKQLTQIINRCENKGNGLSSSAHFFSNSDWDIRSLIRFIATHVCLCELTICLVHIDNQTLLALQDLMREKVIVSPESGEEVYLVNKLNLICQSPLEDNSQRNSINDYLGEYIKNKRAVYAEENIGFRCIAAGNDHRHLMIQGSINQQCCNGIQMFSLTTDRIDYEEAMEVLRSKVRTKAFAWRKFSIPT